MDIEFLNDGGVPDEASVGLSASSPQPSASGLSASIPHAEKRGHKWGPDGERCLKCGDKDWMGGGCIDETPGALALAAIRAFRAVDDFAGWHPNYRDAIELAEEALRASDRSGNPAAGTARNCSVERGPSSDAPQ